MLCYPFEEKRLLKWGLPYIVQPKLDGERCKAIPTPSGYLLTSSEGNAFCLPHISEALNELASDVWFDGELYAEGLSFEEIHSRVSTSRLELHPCSEQIRYHIFDVITHDDARIRQEALDSIFEQFSRGKYELAHVPWFLTLSLEQIMDYLRSFVTLGYEGIIVREPNAPYEPRRSTKIMKFKPGRSDIYRIQGFKEEISKDGVPKGTLGAFILQGPDGSPFGVGSGFTRDEREAYWGMRHKLVGSYCEIRYQHLTDRGVPRFPVFSTLIEEEVK
jgi:DNA ligase-1